MKGKICVYASSILPCEAEREQQARPPPRSPALIQTPMKRKICVCASSILPFEAELEQQARAPPAAPPRSETQGNASWAVPQGLCHFVLGQ